MTSKRRRSEAGRSPWWPAELLIGAPKATVYQLPSNASEQSRSDSTLRRRGETGCVYYVLHNSPEA